MYSTIIENGKAKGVGNGFWNWREIGVEKDKNCNGNVGVEMEIPIRAPTFPL